MTSRERLLAAMNHRRPDRLPMCELQFWPETFARWEAEGYPAGTDPVEYFGLDPLICVNDLFEPSFGLPVQLIEESDEFRIETDSYGKTTKNWKTSSHTQAILDIAVKSMDDWLALKPRLAPGADKFNNPATEAIYRKAAAADDFIAITPAEPLWFAFYSVMGYERGLMAMGEQPELIEDMVATYSDYLLAMLEETLARGYRCDAIWFWSDLCYRNGMLFSPAAARRFVMPHWTRIADFAHGHGMKLIMHCDGNVSKLLPLLVECGFDAIQPLEARAGNDVRVYKPLYGDRLCFIGNINADVVATNDPAAIAAEVQAKVPVAAAGGGYIYHIDHSVPPTVSLDSYRHLLERVRRVEC